MIKCSEGKVITNGESIELSAEFGCIYNALLESGISKDILEYSMKCTEDYKKKKKKPSITKIEINANSKEEAIEQILKADLPEDIKKIALDNI